MWKTPGKEEGKASGGKEWCWSPFGGSALWQEPEPGSAGWQHLPGVREMLWGGVRCKPWVGYVGQHSAGGSWLLANLSLHVINGLQKPSISSAFNLQHPGITPRDTTAGEKPNFLCFWAPFYMTGFSGLLGDFLFIISAFKIHEEPPVWIVTHRNFPSCPIQVKKTPVGNQINQGNNTLSSSTISLACYSEEFQLSSSILLQIVLINPIANSHSQSYWKLSLSIPFRRSAVAPDFAHINLSISVCKQRFQ